MLRHILALALLCGICGCQSDLELVEITPDTLCATAPYPARLQPASTQRIMAVVNAGRIHLVNSLDHPIDDTQVWIDRSYMAHIDRIPARGQVSLQCADFLDSSRQPPPADHLAARVELQTPPGKLYQLAIVRH